MRPTLRATLLLAATTGQLAAAPARAQNDPPGIGHPRPLVAIAHRDLTFGEVFPGIPASVRSDDPRQSGLFEVQGAPDGEVRIEFLLPPALVSPGAALLPLAFGPTDGQADFSRGRFRGVRFDPRAPLIASLGPNGKLYVKLGGTVEPSQTQPGGVYTATISITVFDLGT
jgi:hypothetical protein